MANNDHNKAAELHENAAKSHEGPAPSRAFLHWWSLPHYYFDVRNGRSHRDSLGLDCRDDNGAIAKATFIATQIAIDTLQLNHRHVAVLNDASDEIFEAPIRSKPPVS